LVCGSTAGIGRAIAFALAEKGATITLLARNVDKLKATVAALPGDGHQYLVADFTLTGALEAVLQQSNLLHIDILVNNTGGPPPGKASDSETNQFQAAFEAHLLCNHMLVRSVLPGMKQRRYGRIINIISTSVKIPLHGLGVSNTIRGAVANWAKTLANELAPSGITVNNILPGATATDRLSGIISNKASKVGADVYEIEQDMLSEIPMARFGKPEEIAAGALFLASDMAAYITGTNLVIDGGRTGCL
jgi:3-oxoacyl-[acyl-carrier protein] reductase